MYLGIILPSIKVKLMEGNIFANIVSENTKINITLNLLDIIFDNSF